MSDLTRQNNRATKITLNRKKHFPRALNRPASDRKV